MYISRSFFDSFCIIDFKEGRFRVTQSIMQSQKYYDRVSKEGEKSTLESFGITNGTVSFIYNIKYLFLRDSQIVNNIMNIIYYLTYKLS